MRRQPGWALIIAVGMLAACTAQGSDATAEESSTTPPSSSPPSTTTTTTTTTTIEPEPTTTTTTIEPEPTTTESTAAPTSAPTTAPPAAEPAGLDCGAAPSTASPDLPNGRETTNEVQADLDGDGQDDQLSAFKVSLGGGDVVWTLHVVTADGYAAETELTEADSIANVRPLGTVAIGNGHRAALVAEGVGASAQLVSLWGLHDFDDEPCSLGRLTVGDDTAPLLYPVGGTAGPAGAQGLVCTEVDGTAALAPTTVTPAGGDQSDWTSELLTWSGAGALNIADTDGGTVSTADAADYTGINCPGISLG